MNEQDLIDLQQRNSERVKATIANMGKQYICHEANKVKRKTKKPRRAANGRFQ